MLERYPVSAHWQRTLLGRLDAVGAVHRLATSIADVTVPVGLRWYPERADGRDGDPYETLEYLGRASWLLSD
ncbi:MAG: hypothetical protein OXE02_04540 [Chloroflexi bacterium]|nr:hypothetical protein [Chloroflexota bacterium]